MQGSVPILRLWLWITLEDSGKLWNGKNFQHIAKCPLLILISLPSPGRNGETKTDRNFMSFDLFLPNIKSLLSKAQVLMEPPFPLPSRGVKWFLMKGPIYIHVWYMYTMVWYSYTADPYVCLHLRIKTNQPNVISVNMPHNISVLANMGGCTGGDDSDNYYLRLLSIQLTQFATQVFDVCLCLLSP